MINDQFKRQIVAILGKVPLDQMEHASTWPLGFAAGMRVGLLALRGKLDQAGADAWVDECIAAWNGGIAAVKEELAAANAQGPAGSNAPGGDA